MAIGPIYRAGRPAPLPGSRRSAARDRLRPAGVRRAPAKRPRDLATVALRSLPTLRPARCRSSRSSPARNPMRRLRRRAAGNWLSAPMPDAQRRPLAGPVADGALPGRTAPPGCACPTGRSARRYRSGRHTRRRWPPDAPARRHRLRSRLRLAQPLRAAIAHAVDRSGRVVRNEQRAVRRNQHVRRPAPGALVPAASLRRKARRPSPCLLRRA